jgi:hypothetical protein
MFVYKMWCDIRSLLGDLNSGADTRIFFELKEYQHCENHIVTIHGQKYLDRTSRPSSFLKKQDETLM